MATIKVEYRGPAPFVVPDGRELFERIERLQRRIALMLGTLDFGEAEVRRQRATGRRP